MRKFIYLFFSGILILSCNQKTTLSNQELIKKIDSIKETYIAYEIKVDSTGKSIDTISIEKNKRNDKEDIVYSQKIIPKNKGKITITNYYSDSGNLIKSKVISSELGVVSISEFWESDGLISNGHSIEYENNIATDTVKIDYKHEYKPNGNIEKTTISAYIDKQDISGKNTTTLHYDANSNLEYEFFIQDGDTLRETNYIYNVEKIKNKSIIDYSEQLLVNFEYDENGFIYKQEVYKETSDSIIKTKDIHYKTNDKGEVIDKTETLFPSMIKTNYNYDRHKKVSNDIKEIRI